MENLFLSFRVVSPLLIYMLIGMLLRKGGVVARESFSAMSQVVFYVAIPVLCMESLWTSDLSVVLENPFTLYMALGVLAVFVLAMLTVPRVVADNRRRGVIVQSIFRSNDGVFGLAVATMLFAEGHMALMALTVALTIPLYNVLAVIDMEWFRGGKVHLGHILLQVAKNPIILGCVSGALLNLLHAPVPELLAKPIGALADLSAPLGFIALGGTLSFVSMKKNRRAIAVLSLLRLVVIPLAAILILLAVGYRGDYLLVAMIIFGAPVAMSLYPMACAMEGDAELAGEVIAVSSALSILTVFLFIFVLKQLGLA